VPNTVRRLALIVAAMSSGEPLRAGDPPARFAITTRKPADAVTPSGDATRTVFDVTSPSGIGRAEVTRTGDAWPKAVTVRLRLGGLEHFTASHGATAIGAAVGVRDGRIKVRAWAGKDEAKDLAANDPLRAAVRVLDAAGRPAPSLPVQDGVVEVDLPAAFFADNPKAIALDWIDFYR
jgi:hypothetical protein